MNNKFQIRGFLRENATLLSAVQHVLDWFIVLFMGWFAHFLYLGHVVMPKQYVVALIAAVLLIALSFGNFRVYRGWRGTGLLEQFGVLAVAWSAVVIAMVVMAFLTKTSEDFSRAWLLFWAVLSLLGLVANRVALRYVLSLMRARGFNLRTIVIVGTPELGAEVAARLQSARWTGLYIAGCFCDDEIDSSSSELRSSFLGRIADLPQYLKNKTVDEVWLALPFTREKEILDVLQLLRNSTVEVRFVPDFFGLQLAHRSITEVAGMSVINLSITPMQGVNRVIKWLEDRVLAFIILVLISPLMLLIALAIRLDSPGPVIFKQKRHGWNGKPIEIWKFRSMHNVPESETYRQASRNDARVTPLGSFLRRTSLDELPQFFNVLQGRMSIVGPRPHPIKMNEMYVNQVDRYMQRHKVKPGITGWAQVNGLRGEVDSIEKIEKRIEYDLFYIDNWSLWFDLKIILLTVFKGFVHRNAY